VPLVPALNTSAAQRGHPSLHNLDPIENCPPQSSFPPDGLVVYSLVKGDIPMPDDFQSVRGRNPGKKFPEADKECRARGLSVSTNPSDMDVLRRLSRGFREGRMARAVLRAPHGLVMRTQGPSDMLEHHTWWTAPSVAPHTLFEVRP
jgi:hypothetical protein